MKAIFLLFLMLFNPGCTAKRGEVPPDFNIQVKLIPAGPSDFGYAKELRQKTDSAGKTSFELIQSSEVENYMITVNNDDVLKLYHEILNQKIMEMEEEYTNYKILDGGTTEIQLRMNGKKKRISLLNIRPPQLHNFFAILQSMKTSK